MGTDTDELVLMEKRKRRRVVRISDSPDYDRSADGDSFAAEKGMADHDRMVIFESDMPSDEAEDDLEDGSLTLDFYQHERPPHYEA